jgi:hypothetical protein
MAEFSKEYIEINPILDHYDFSIIEIGNELLNGQTENRVCEGFGIIGITKENNTIYVQTRLFGIITQIEFTKFLNNYKGV